MDGDAGWLTPQTADRVGLTERMELDQFKKYLLSLDQHFLFTGIYLLPLRQLFPS